jgi:multiple antibiotic resistance protein
MTVFSAALLLFLVMDPFGNISFFITALEPVAPGRRTRVVVRELFIALAFLVTFLFAGQHLLGALGISGPALTVAGGTVLFLIAVRMIFPTSRATGYDELAGEPFIVPLAVPYVAGPSAMASLLLIMNREPERYLEWLLAVFAAWLATGIILSMAPLLARLLGKRVLIAIERLMGMVLVAIAIQMMMAGVARFIAEQ